jgi:hypothetical protein
MSAGDRLGFEIERFGDRLGVDFLRYNPVVFKMYDRLAVRDSPAIVSALRTHFPGACRVIDVGAGSGAFAAEARRQGLTATAIERSRHGRRLAKRHGIRALHFDLRATPPQQRSRVGSTSRIASKSRSTSPASWPTNSSTSSVNSHRQLLLPPRRQARGGRVTSMNNPPVTGRHVLLPEGTRQHL